MTPCQTPSPRSVANHVVVALVVTGCTQLGPMPATTALSAVPASRPHLEAQLGAVPGYYLSSTVTKEPEGAAVRQVSASLEPDRWIGVPGLVVGGRAVGSSEGDVYGEPFVAYRQSFGAARSFSAAAVVYGTHAGASEHHASYEATRLGAELATDLRITPQSHWLELHALAGGSLTALDASGYYCLDPLGQYGIDCDGDTPVRTHASASGFYPALNVGLAFDLAQHLRHYFHGVRLAALFSTGSMPRVVYAEQTDPELFTSFGLSISMGIGAKDDQTKAARGARLQGEP